MKAMVLGAGGVGSVVADILSRSEAYDEIVLASRTKEKVEAAAKKIGNEKIRPAVINADNVAEMKKGMKDVDLAINLVLPRYFLKVMQAALESGTNYMDTATDLAVAADQKAGQRIEKVPMDLQLEQDDKWKAAGLSAMLSWGVDPGSTNVFARYAADRMDSVDRILVRDGDNSYIEGFEGFAALWSPDTLIEEVALMDALVWSQGRFERIPSLSKSEMWEFPDPVGKLEVWAVDHEEQETLGRFIGKGCKECNFMIALGDNADILKALKAVNLVSPDPIMVKGTKVVPRDVVTALMPSPTDPDIQSRVKGDSCVGTAVIGKKGDKKMMHYIYNTMNHEECYRQYKATATSVQTATPPAIAAIMFARGEIDRKGVYPPEMLEPDPIMKRFNEMGYKTGEIKKELD